MSKQRRILVENENDLLGRLIATIFRDDARIDFVRTQNAAATHSLLRAYKVNLLIVDHMMDGLPTLDRIRRIRAGGMGCKKTLPIMVLANPHADPGVNQDTQRQVLDAGADLCLFKPVSIRRLYPAAMLLLDRPGKATPSVPAWSLDMMGMVGRGLSWFGGRGKTDAIM